MSGFGKIYESSNWGVGVCDNTIGWGSSYKSIANCTDASFSYSADSFAQNGSNPTPTITGDAGGTFTATPSGLSLNASTGEITLSTSTINSYTIRYTLPDTTFAEQTVGITAAPFASTRSFSFDGVDDYFTSDLDMSSSNITISYWLNANGSSYSANQYFSPFYLKAGNAVNQSLGTLYKRPNLHAGLQGYDSTDTTYATWTAQSVNLEGTGWHHILWTFNNTTKHTYCYIDGTAQTFTNAFGSDTTSFITSRNINMTTPLSIGGSPAAAGPKYFEGLIDEVAVWNSVLSSAAVTEIYNTGVPNDLDELTNASDPTAWYRMGE